MNRVTFNYNCAIFGRRDAATREASVEYQQTKGAGKKKAK